MCVWWCCVNCEASEWISTTDIPRLLQRAVCAADWLPLPEWCHAHALGLTLLLQLSHGSMESLLCLLIKAQILENVFFQISSVHLRQLSDLSAGI